MYNHAPQNYVCPLCLAVQGIENEHTMMKQDDIFFRDEYVMAAVNSKFVEKNPGHVIVVPLRHYENIYELPILESHRIMEIAKRVAIALKEIRKCDGVTILQNNEPASNQHAFHYHMHVFPRFENDDLHSNVAHTIVASPEERKQYSSPLRLFFHK